MTAVAISSPTKHNVFQPSKSGDPLMNIRCHCDQQVVTLTGTVARFYHVQLAIEAARKIAEGRKIDVRIEVITPPKMDVRADWLNDPDGL